MPLSFKVRDPQTGQEHSFDPGRDISYFWPQLLDSVLVGCAQKNWQPPFKALLVEHNVTEGELLSCLNAYGTFCGNAVEPESTNMEAALASTGFFNHRPIAQFVVLAKLGQVCTGAFWGGVRHSVISGVVPQALKMIKKSSAELDKILHEMYKDVEINKGQALPCTADLEKCT